MADILVVHPNLMAHAGSAAVCMNTLEALQDKHEVTLFTTGSVDLDERNRFFATNVTGITIYRHHGIERLEAGLRMTPLPPLVRLIKALQERVANTRAQAYDLVISTDGSLRIDCPSLEYVHFPRGVEPEPSHNPRHRFPAQLVELYDSLWKSIAPSGGNGPTVYRTNSAWTATFAEAALDAPVGVLYPPVPTDVNDSKPWADRENRILSVGRIAPDKEILRNVEIVVRLHELGHEFEYEIIGPTAAHHEEYVNSVRRLADRYEFVTCLGRLPRKQLVERIASSKYGLHGKAREHFGISVAELVAGGTIPFVPADGGQCEIVGYDDRTLYDSVEDAVEKMDRTLRSVNRQRLIRDGFPDVSVAYSRERFQAEMDTLVTELLANGGRTDETSRRKFDRHGTTVSTSM